jgi:hypothetical protein
LAMVPPKRTLAQPLKLPPEMSTTWLLEAESGAKAVTTGTGGGLKVKPDREPVPMGVVTLTFPLAPAPTVATMLLSLSTEKDLALTPPNLTEVVPRKPVPDIVTTLPL